MTVISDFLARNSQRTPRIAVVGDMMIDEYYKVDVKRISPEAPIPVMRSDDDKPFKVVPGGAANVAYQLKNWNVECTLFGMLSPKDYEILQHFTNIVPISLSKRIPVKKRFQDGQNLIRWDIETEGFEIGEEYRQRFLEEFRAKIEGGSFELAILSDYGKGFFNDFKFTQEIITLCHINGITTVVDPKDEPIEKWVGCSIFKPNSVEAERFTDVKDPKFQCQRLAEKLGGSNVVTTYGGCGVLGMLVEGKTFAYWPGFSAEVTSVIGAGDSFVSHLALAVAHDFSVPQAVEIAYKAGASYVQREYNKPVYPYELIESKFISPHDLKNRDFKLVATNGCYDLFHAGHLETFKFAKTKGDKLAVLINADESVKSLKGNGRPIIPLAQRQEIIASLECVDFVLAFKSESPYNLYKEIQPDVLVKGESSKYPRSAELAKEFYYAPFVEGVSTTNLIERIRDAANQKQKD